jgi:hypothetical protein
MRLEFSCNRLDGRHDGWMREFVGVADGDGMESLKDECNGRRGGGPNRG